MGIGLGLGSALAFIITTTVPFLVLSAATVLIVRALVAVTTGPATHGIAIFNDVLFCG